MTTRPGFQSSLIKWLAIGGLFVIGLPALLEIGDALFARWYGTGAVTRQATDIVQKNICGTACKIDQR